MFRVGAVAVTIATLAGCTVPEDTPGSVYEVTQHTVTIRGAYDMSLGGKAHPTAAMIQQAKDICPGATYLSATPSNLHEYDYTFRYLFRCPNGPA
ncbi:MAG: hypothetical protein ABNH26_08710 [Celeribacter sp.]